MQQGIYDQIVNLLLKRRLESLKQDDFQVELLDSADSHNYLAQYIYRILTQGLSQVRHDSGLTSEAEKNASRIQRQIQICNEIINSLTHAGIEGFDDAKISNEAKRLLAILENTATIVQSPVRPDTPLALGALLTGTRQDPSLVSQLQKEIISADRIDILCSFIKWSGIRILENALRTFTKKTNTRLRVITTSYMGATDLKAIRLLSELSNTEIKVSYDTHRTRLHAKAYLIYRNTGFSSAYIGSSNISSPALTDGLEWNVKISQYEQPFQWEKIAATFETYWNDSEFESYNGSVDENRLQMALTEEKSSVESDQFVLPNFDLRPYSFQQEILDRITVERQLQQRKKHLIVAATGTGKTMIAAFDFKAWCQNRRDLGFAGQPRFLFVAHRKEILRQSLYTFRAVLRDQNFGDMMVGGSRPQQLEQLFISIQTYNSHKLSQMVSSEHYEYVVIDEFHHSAAPSYQDLINHVEPASLLGLTATPERADSKNIKQYFDDHITAEIRLPDAINRKLLCPFQYFGISDPVDYSTLRWQKGGYVQADLENILTGNDVRANLIIEKVVSNVLNVSKTRGIGFCVSQAHAEYMARKFNTANVPADFLTSESNCEHRNTVQRRLRDREINFIFVVDLYNEGVDIPEIDTVIFLRPTESLTVFLQQLGRGLRLSENKDCLVVLDFVGHAHKKFRFDIRFKALQANPNRRIIDEIEDGFPYLPAGCSIQFEKQAYQHVLDNIKQSLVQSKPRIIQNIASFSADTDLVLTLSNFLDYYRLTLDDIYRCASWARLCVEAEVRENFTDPDEFQLTKGLRRLHHIDDMMQIDRLLNLLKKTDIDPEQLSGSDQKRLLMLCFTLWGREIISSTLGENLNRINLNPVLRGELIELLGLCRERIQTVSPIQKLSFDCPLQIHAKYTRDEILVALGYWNLQLQPTIQAGVLYLPDLNVDSFFITLNKNEKHYSPTTMYEDYAISETLFHWQSQARTSEQSSTGQRYINQRTNGNTVLLFVRENRTNTSNLVEPYHFLGAADYVSHRGSQPISIIWQLRSPMPAYLLRQTSRLVVG
jgi:superfamily II DNA or RNA helicase